MIGTTRVKGNEAHPRRDTMTMRIWLCSFAILAILLPMGQAWADDDNTEEGLFTAVAPDAMIVLDLSGSMKWNPPGDHDSWNNPTNLYSNATCSGPFYSDQSHSGYTTLCSRYEIARKTLFNVLDDNRDGTINADDESSMNIRFGLGKFQGQHLHEAARHRGQVLRDLLRQQHLHRG